MGLEHTYSFGAWIANRRKALDLTRAELAQRSGCSVSALRKIEADERRPSKQLAGLLASCLGIPPDDHPAFIEVARGQLRVERLDRVAVQTEIRPQLPAFLTEGAERVAASRPGFVGRERELGRLDGFLNAALGGNGAVCFVTGGPGRGKTALMEAFAQRAMEVHPDLLVAMGACNAYTGEGDPYLPFRDVMGMLTGDVEAKWAAGAITHEHARRLWTSLSLTLQALLKHGPHLVDVFVPGAALLPRAMVATRGDSSWVQRLDELVGQKRARSDGLEQNHLFQQVTNVLRVLAATHPLVLVLDDLQWADTASIGLLFHLGRRLGGSRVLIVSAYRPEEVAIGRPSTLRQAQETATSGERERHPLEELLAEFKRRFGDVFVDLGQADEIEGQRFVDALVKSEPNCLGEAFRRALFEHSEGHPLFTVELLRAMQERGDLIQDQHGRWVEGSTLDWETMPPRVEGVIEGRIGRLDEDLREILSVASVEGEVFTAEVVAHVLGIDEKKLVQRLSSELDRRHRLVQAQAIERLGSQCVSRYRFRHHLFHKYLYDSLDQGERIYLHEDVGNALEELYREQTSEIAAQLARHFQEASIAEKAIHYLHQAGARAVQLSAYQEAVAHLTRGLALLLTQPDSLERAQQELALQLTLGLAWVGPKGCGPDVEKALVRARELCQQMGETHQLCRVLGELSILHFVRAEHQRARELGEQALSLAQQAGDPLLVALDHSYLGFILFCLGEYTTALGHLNQMIAFYNPKQHHRSLVTLRGSDVGLSALAYAACCLWCLGYPDQALKRSQEALALALELGHPFSLADVLCHAGCLFNAMRRDAQALDEYAEDLQCLASDKVLGWLGQGTWFRGKALAMLDHLEEGIAQMREGLTLARSGADRCYQSGCLCSLAEAQARAGYQQEGLSTLAEALALMQDTDERHWEAELYRLRAELLLMQGDEAKAEVSLHNAIEIARRQSAKSWELRAGIGLARLWQKQDRTGEARQVLAQIYGWFTEGFDTPDLKQAETLLEELSQKGGYGPDLFVRRVAPATPRSARPDPG